MKFRLQRYIIFCEDMASMVQFYRDALGLTLSLQSGMPVTDWAEFGEMGFKLALHKAGSPGSKGRNRNKMVFEVEDIEAGRTHLVAHGARMGKIQNIRVSDICDGKDPEGNMIQITADRP
ncbi:MAG: hypothetical protein CME19_05490 [Gemmatimonadetes bacterium]|nr:hypothetical protein [Gemmatimonadota bacterium]|tara:strand:+ start:1217 stop:1576 length:360 start_codon:yes stop_codon:yes gene_type:complete